MALKQDDLKYIEVVRGRIAHFIFKQGSYYFVLTETDNKSRGNFLAIHQEEVDKVNTQLSKNSISSPFHCDNIYRGIRELDIRLDHENPQYFINRLRNICYILVANGQLSIQKDGNSIWFSKRRNLPNDSKSLPAPKPLVTSKRVSTSPPAPPTSKKPMVPCLLCNAQGKVKVREDRLQKHICSVHPTKSPSTGPEESRVHVSSPVERNTPTKQDRSGISNATREQLLNDPMDGGTFKGRIQPHDSDGTFLSSPVEDDYSEESGPDVYDEDEYQ